ncbi:MAG: PfkB family carbohydrate kinase, partial [Oscillospiraceae bacterium]
MKNALVIGSSCVDVVIKIHHLPTTGEDIHPQSQSFMAGGCAYNVANIIKRAGENVTFITPVGGAGVFGMFVKTQLDFWGFSDYITLPKSENGCCYCFVEDRGERTFISCHGAEYTFNSKWMAKYKNTDFDYGYFCGLEVEEETGAELISYLKGASIKNLFYAPGPRGVHIGKEKTGAIYALHPILHINDSEAMALGNGESVERSAIKLFEKTKNTVIVTLGDRGALWYDGAFHTMPAVKTQ